MGCEYWQRTTDPLKDKQDSSKPSKKSDRTDELVLKSQPPLCLEEANTIGSLTKSQTNKKREATRDNY